MKFLPFFAIYLLCLFTSLQTNANQFPVAYDPYINDYARLISSNDEAHLIQSLESHRLNTGHQISVVTLENASYYSNDGETFPQFAERLFQYWQSTQLNQSSRVLVILDKTSQQITIKLSETFPAHYQNIVSEITDNVQATLPGLNDYGPVIQQVTDQLVSVTLSEISFIQWHKWKFLAGFYLLFSFIIALLIGNHKKIPLTLWFLGFAGLCVLTVLRSLFPNNYAARN